MSEFFRGYLEESAEIGRRLDLATLERMVDRLGRLREEKGRLFICGVGGSAGNASHAACDFRKLAGIEAYAPTDNGPELTARTNDEGWDTVFSGWLRVSQANERDVLLVLSVGGGSRELNISPNLVAAVDEAKGRGLDVIGIVGRDGGYTKARGDLVLVVPTVNEERVTPHTESFQTVLWHALVSHPKLMRSGNKWERTTQKEGASSSCL